MADRWRRGWIIAVLAVMLAALMTFHSAVPNGARNLGSLLETFLPWLGLGIPVLGVMALIRRAPVAGLALIAPAAVWLLMFGSIVLPGKGGGAHDLRVVANNVNSDNQQPADAAQALVDADPDLIALVELTEEQRDAFGQALREGYPHRAVHGTVGLWSRYPIVGSQPVDLRIGWDRALRAVVDTPAGEVAVYVAHMPSVRISVEGAFTVDDRDRSAQALGEAIAGEQLDRVVLLGDLNGSVYDRALAPITSQLESTQAVAGQGFGFTWPARFPLARIDHVLIRGVEATRSWVLPDNGSDHRPVAAELRLG